MKEKFYAVRSWLTLLLLCVGMGAWGQTATQDNFTAVSAKSIGGDANVSYTTAQGGGTSVPLASGGVIRLYQKSSSSQTSGGTITISAAAGCTLQSVTIGSSMGTSIAYTVDDETTLSATASLAANDTYTVSDLSASSITFYCMGTSKTTRLYVNKLSVTYATSGLTYAATPTFTPASGTTFDGSLEVTIASATDDATIYYTTDGTAPAADGTGATLYTGGFTLTSTTTVKAIAVKDGMAPSSVAEATYTKLDEFASLAALKAAFPATTTELIVTLTDAVVTAVSGNNAMIQTADAGITYFKSGHGLTAGQVINGRVKVTTTVYDGLNEVTSLTLLDEATITDGGTIPTTDVLLSAYLAAPDAYESMRIRIVDATVTSAFASRLATVTQSGNEIQLYDNANASLTANEAAVVDVTGYPQRYVSGTTDRYQLRVLTQADIVEKVGGLTTATVAFDADAYTVNLGESLTVHATTNSTSAIVYTSSDEAVATIDAETGAVTVLTAGVTTLTASVAANAAYTSASASVLLTVTDPAVVPEYKALVGHSGDTYYAMLAEVGSGSNSLGALAVDVVNGQVVLTDDSRLSSLRWLIKTSVDAGTSTTKAVISTVDGKYLSGSSSKTDLTLSTTSVEWTVDADGAYGMGSRTLLYQTSGYFKNFASSNIGEKNYGDTKTFPMPLVDGYTRAVTADNYGTLCLPQAVAASDWTGATFYEVAGKRMDGSVVKSIVLNEVTELEAGKPYIFRATDDRLLAAYTAGTSAPAQTVNGLVGTLEDINSERDAEDVRLQGKYLLSGGVWRKCGKGCSVAANRAYIDMDAVPEVSAGVKGFELFVGSVPTAVTGAKAEAGAGEPMDVYTLDGVCVRRNAPANAALTGLRAGIYLIRGEKVIVK